MKKVLKPSSEEKAHYYSDCSKKPFKELPPITITCEFNYGSKLDETVFEMHFTDEEFLTIYNSFKDKLAKESTKKINSLLKKLID